MKAFNNTKANHSVLMLPITGFIISYISKIAYVNNPQDKLYALSYFPTTLGFLLWGGAWVSKLYVWYVNILLGLIELGRSTYTLHRQLKSRHHLKWSPLPRNFMTSGLLFEFSGLQADYKSRSSPFVYKSSATKP